MYAAHYAVLFFVPQVHCAALAVTVIAAFFANAFFCPTPLPHYFKAVVPYVLKVISVNIALDKVPVDVRAGGD
jgi:hypothetical protein